MPVPDKPLRLGFLCPHNPHDRGAFSGTAFHASRALSERGDVHLDILGSHPRHPRLARFMPSRSEASNTVGSQDAIVALVASCLIDKMPAVTPPVVHVTDATPSFLRDVYGWNIPDDICAREARVLKRANKVVYSSHAMALRAQGEPGLAAGADISVVPFGLNSATLPLQPPMKPSLQCLELVFVGQDWTRKGGDIAVATLRHLQAQGRAARLTLVGPCPDRLRRDPAVLCTGFLDQNKRAQRARLASIYANAHVMILPTQADCTPMVVAEAMSRGTPVLASDTGGMGTLIAPGTGRLLPRDAPPALWAETLLEMTQQKSHYDLLSDAAFERVQARLNWTAWADDMVALLHETLAQTRSRPLGLAA